MDRLRLESQWDRFAAGESLSGDERAELLRALWSDPGLRADFLEDEKIRRTLIAFGRGDGPGFIASFLHRLEIERNKTEFIRQVRARITGDGVPSRTRRRRWASVTDPGRRSWQTFLLAGGVVATAAAWMILAFPSNSLPHPEHGERRGPAQVAGAAPPEQGRVVQTEKPKGDANADQEPRLNPEKPARTPDPVRESNPSGGAATQPSASAAKDPAPVAPARPEPGRATVTATLARIERAEGATRLSGHGQSPLRKGEALETGHGIEVGKDGAATLVYADGTCLVLGPGTLVKEFALKGGKRIFLTKGSLQARVAPQPVGEAMEILTPHGEATVLGTTLEIIVGSDPQTGTQLQVTEGKVHFKNRFTGKAVDVEAGRFAVAALGTPLAALLQYRIVWALNLKSQRMPAAVVHGSAAKGPPLPENSLCLQSVPGDFGPFVDLALDQVVTCDPARMRLRFRYFTTAERMCVQLWCPRVEDNLSADIVPLIPSAWTSVELPLSKLSRRSDGGKLRKGDFLKLLDMFVTGGVGAPVFWDQLELVERITP